LLAQARHQFFNGAPAWLPDDVPYKQQLHRTKVAAPLAAASGLSNSIAGRGRFHGQVAVAPLKSQLFYLLTWPDMGPC
jgi:hypothetical protein